LVANNDDSTSKTSGILAGTVLDDKKEPLISATVQVYKDTILVGGAVTDFDGKYMIANLQSGSYDLLFTYVGYDSLKIDSVVISPNDTTTQNVFMERDPNRVSLGMMIINYQDDIYRSTPRKQRKAQKRFRHK
jgi:hypothetical protein